MKTTVTFIVHSLDAAGVARFFEEHGAEISAVVDRAKRRRPIVTWRDRSGVEHQATYYGDWMGLLLGGALLILLELVLLR